MSEQKGDTFRTRTTLTSSGKDFEIFSLAKLKQAELGSDIDRLPISLKVLLENLLRHDSGAELDSKSIAALVNWDSKAIPDSEIAFAPARTLLQDFTGVPCVVDLAAMRDAAVRMGIDPNRINPLERVDLVIDHSVQIDFSGSRSAFLENTKLEYERNQERYTFLRWGAGAFSNFSVVPPDTGIVHQVNLEFLASVVFTKECTLDVFQAYPDTLVGTDSHTPMVNALGVLGWGVGGIEAEAAMLGQPISMLIPQVIGMKLTGKLPAGTTATDLVLMVTQILRKKGVVGRFVEFFGDGLAELSVPNRATISNMAPEYGATVGFFPVDEKTLEYLRFTGRSDEQIALVEAYCRHQGLFRMSGAAQPEFTDVVELDLGTVEPSLAGPRRPQDRVLLKEMRPSWRQSLVEFIEASKGKLPDEVKAAWLSGASAATAAATLPDLGALDDIVRIEREERAFEITHGAVVIASITSCTNTSNPSVMIGAGLLAKKAVERGLKVKPWVKTSLAPGSKVVREYLQEAGLMGCLEELGFHIVSYGCATCIGNSGPLPEDVSQAVTKGDLVAAAVLSGNRNFEGRINPLVRANYLASPPLVVAYALAGNMDIDLTTEPIGADPDGNPVMLSDIWPSQAEVNELMQKSVQSEMFRQTYAQVFHGDEVWRSLPVPQGKLFAWDEASTYVKEPPFFTNLSEEVIEPGDITGARVLAMLGHSVTTDHISPAGSISPKGPAGMYLLEHGVQIKDFNSYGARRGNHEVMMRGTFANIRLRNLLAPGTEGGVTLHQPEQEPMSIYDAAMRYKDEGVPSIVIAGKEYGSGSSRDWAAKGPALLGVRAVIAESYERIHRSNLVGMGVLPLQFEEGQDREILGLTGNETYEIIGIAAGIKPGMKLKVRATSPDGKCEEFTAIARIDTPNEVQYYRHGGILPYVLMMLAHRERRRVPRAEEATV
ncbi:MAG: aconitate hydratase AcnA [Candidatus Sumerlaeaceae bacterium]